MASPVIRSSLFVGLLSTMTAACNADPADSKTKDIIRSGVQYTCSTVYRCSAGGSIAGLVRSDRAYPSEEGCKQDLLWQLNRNVCGPHVTPYYDPIGYQAIGGDGSAVDIQCAGTCSYYVYHDGASPWVMSMAKTADGPSDNQARNSLAVQCSNECAVGYGGNTYSGCTVSNVTCNTKDQ